VRLKDVVAVVADSFDVADRKLGQRSLRLNACYLRCYRPMTCKVIVVVKDLLLSC